MNAGILPCKSSKVWSLTAALVLRTQPMGTTTSMGLWWRNSTHRPYCRAPGNNGYHRRRADVQCESVLCEVCVDAPVALMIEFVRLYPQTGFDVAQTFSIGQLSKFRAAKLV